MCINIANKTEQTKDAYQQGQQSVMRCEKHLSLGAVICLTGLLTHTCTHMMLYFQLHDLQLPDLNNGNG